MARLDDIPEPTRTAVRDLPCPTPETSPFVAGPALAQRKIAMVSSAALIHRGDKPFPVGSGEVRAVPGSWKNGDILMGHVSINFDRAGFQRDINVAYPIDRLRDMAAEGEIGGLVDPHYTVMGSTDPAAMKDAADHIAAALHAEGCTGILLLPV